MRSEPEIRAALADLELELTRRHNTVRGEIVGISLTYMLAWILNPDDERGRPIANMLDTIRRQTVLEGMPK